MLINAYNLFSNKLVIEGHMDKYKVNNIYKYKYGMIETIHFHRILLLTP